MAFRNVDLWEELERLKARVVALEEAAAAPPPPEPVVDKKYKWERKSPVLNISQIFLGVEECKNCKYFSTLNMVNICKRRKYNWPEVHKKWRTCGEFYPSWRAWVRK